MPGVTAGPVEDVQLVGSWFMVDVPGLKLQSGITAISGLAMEIGAVEESVVLKDGKTELKKRPAVVQYGEITLKRLMSTDKSLWDWAKKVRDGKDYRLDGSIILYDTTNTEVSRWNFTNGWPSKWSASDLDAGTDDPMTEEITIQIEMLQRMS
jgi:phage tail-like protein